MLSIILYQPEIPPNTGNIIRLASNTGCDVQLVQPLGFELDDKRLRRAGLDYHEFSSLIVHDDWEQCLQANQGRRLLACSTKGSTNYCSLSFREDDCLLFGPETRGLPSSILDDKEIDSVIRIPMLPSSRSLNLSNSAAVIVYEAWRQLGFPGAG